MSAEFTGMIYGPDMLPPTPGVFFVDTETTGLHRGAQVWEIALIEPDGQQYVWMIEPIQMVGADVRALRLNGFKDRYPKGKKTNPSAFLKEFAELTWDLHWAGMIPSFDERQIMNLYDMWDHDVSTVMGGWSHHLIDVESMALGYYGVDKVGIPWRSSKLIELAGIDESTQGMDARHTALGDARLAKKLFLAMAGDLTELDPKGIDLES